MQTKTNLFEKVKKILKDVRFGILSNRINPKQFPNDTEFVKDFNNMIDAISDREKMIKEYQATIINTNEYLQSLFNMLNDAAMTLSEDFKIITVNDAQAKLFRQSKKSLISKTLFNILKKYEIKDLETGQTINNYTYFTKEKKENYNYKLSFELKKITFYTNVNIKPFINKDGETNYFIVSTDITSDIKLQKLKDTFIATLTHDLKVPIIAEAKVLNLLLKEDFSNNPQFKQEAIKNMLDNNSDMLELVSTLLDVYKLENEAYAINTTLCNIEKIIKTEAEKLKYLLKDNYCEIKISTTTKKTMLNADSKEISRVFKNILTNAVTFAPENSKIKVKLYEENNSLIIDIIDKGVGITEKDLPHIFERYYTADKKYRKVGTGLGLYLSKKIIRLHGGEIYAQSIPNEKTTFTIKLPY